jgi:predicted phosphoadenosine phosphosulfate sulfurtransferase
VEGANFGNKYSGDKALGNFVIKLPSGHTYKTYAKFLLSTLPPHIEQHYRKKIYKFLKYWKKHKEELPNKRLPDFGERKLEASRKVGSWRRIVKVLLKNDYWCKGLSFSQTKREMERQMDVVSRCYDNF